MAIASRIVAATPAVLMGESGGAFVKTVRSAVKRSDFADLDLLNCCCVNAMTLITTLGFHFNAHLHLRTAMAMSVAPAIVVGRRL